MTSIESNPRIYYRTNATRSALASYPDPADDFSTWIANFPSAQILEFEDTTFIIEELKRIRQMNITYDPKSNPDGTLSIASQFNGILGKDLQFIISCDANQDAKLNKLEAFMFRLQKEQSFHKNGSIGIWFPPAHNYSLDPDDTKGYYFDNDETAWQSRSKEVLSYRGVLKFGGTKVART